VPYYSATPQSGMSPPDSGPSTPSSDLRPLSPPQVLLLSQVELQCEKRSLESKPPLSPAMQRNGLPPRLRMKTHQIKPQVLKLETLPDGR
jgi:hypothetical protein